MLRVLVCVWIVGRSMSSTSEMPPDGTVFRVEINLKTNYVEVFCFSEADCVDKEAEGYYSSVDDLPEWIQNKLAVLMTIDHTPPISPVEGVGKRISKNIFWVFA